jgi:hypothetical protein
MVLFTTGLALAAVLLLNYFAGLPGIRSRIRWDMTLDSRNTLSASTEGVLRNLQDKVEIDVFFRG